MKEKSKLEDKVQKVPKPANVNGSSKRRENTSLIHLKEGEKEWTLKLKPMDFEGEDI